MTDQSVLQEILFNNLVMEWNRKINIVSRQKTDVFDLIEDSKLFLKHIEFFDGIKILDLGTGGGFPGIPIKIHKPQTRMVLVDSVKKKIDVVNDIIDKMGLLNTHGIWSRAEDLIHLPLTKGETQRGSVSNNYKNSFDYIVSRSVAPLFNLTKWSRNLLKPDGKLVTLKGKDIADELSKTSRQEFVKNIISNNEEDRLMITVEFQ